MVLEIAQKNWLQNEDDSTKESSRYETHGIFNKELSVTRKYTPLLK